MLSTTRMLITLLAVGAMLLLPVGAAAAPVEVPEAPATSDFAGFVNPVFDAEGPDGTPGVWVWGLTEGRWEWLAATVGTGGLGAAAVSETQPPWPADPAVIQVVPAADGEYWVWDVFAFVGTDSDSSGFWMPRWQRVSSMTLLGQ